MGWRRALRGCGVTVLAVVLVGWLPALAGAATTVAFTISDKRITANAGMARDTAANLYWTINDSGSTGVVYGVGSDGKVRGTLNYRVDPTDTEAVAVNGSRLYVGDIGDKDEKRDHVVVYYFDDPRANGLTVSYRSWDFRYPDGAHDAATLLVTDKGRIYIATKGTTGHLYRAPENPSRTGVNDLTKVGADLPAGITDGVIMPGGAQIALLTTTQAVMIDAKTGKEEGTSTLSGPDQPQALAVSLDGKSLLVGSSGKDAKVYTLAVPASAGAGTGSGTASPSATAADPGGDVIPDDSSPASPAQRGTLLAVGIAGLVAIVAGVVVAVARRPGPG